VRIQTLPLISTTGAPTRATNNRVSSVPPYYFSPPMTPAARNTSIWALV